MTAEQRRPLYAYCVLAILAALFIGQRLDTQTPLGHGHAGSRGLGIASGVMISAGPPGAGPAVEVAVGQRAVLGRAAPSFRATARTTRPVQVNDTSGSRTVRSPQEPAATPAPVVEDAPGKSAGHGQGSANRPERAGRIASARTATDDRPGKGRGHALGNGRGHAHGKARR